MAQKVANQREAIHTEEATKNAFVMPFISNVLGYDVFDPLEVVPEFTADVGIKRGEKVDYAIMRDGEVQILIECKASTGAPKIEHASQLFRYFSTTNARIAALTNGVVWQFFTDLDAPNRMDAKPFLVLDLLDDNNRKPIARLHFNARQKYLGLLDEDKAETRHPLDSLDEIYAHADAIR